MPVFHGWKVVAACFCIAVIAWTLGLFGASVYLQTITAAHGWPIAGVSSAITLFYLVAALLQPLVGRAFDRFGARLPMTVGAVSMGAGAALIGQVSAPWQLYPCFVLIGVGWSTLSTTGISATVAPWFERHQGRSITLAIMGASLAAIAGVPALIAVVSWLGLSQGFATAGAIAVLVLLPLVWGALRHRGPSALGLARDGDALPAQGTASDAVPVPLATHIARPRWLLWSAAAGFALGLNVQIGFVTHHVALATPSIGLAGAGLLVSGSGLAAFAGRLVLARIVDRMDVRWLAALAMLAQASSLFLIAWLPTVPVLVGASLVYGFCIGYVTTLAPVVVRREFGAAAFGRIYGTAAIAIQLTSAFGPALLGALRDGFGGYAPGLSIAGGITVLGAAALLMGRRIAARPTLPSGC
jgi:MFS family permease